MKITSKRILGKYYDVYLIRLAFEMLFVILPAAFLIRTFIFGLYQVPSGSMEHALLVGERFLADKLTYWFRAPRRGEVVAFNEPLYEYSNNKLKNLWERYASWNVSNWTKRIIGIPGDHVVGKIEDGKTVVYLNGKKLDESAYVNSYPLIRVFKSNEAARRGLSGRLEGRWWDDKTFVPSVSNPLMPADNQPFYKIDKNLIIYADPSAGIPLLVKWPQQPEPVVGFQGTPIDEFDVKLGPNQYWMMGDNRRGSADSRMWGPLDADKIPIHGKIIFRIWSMDSDESWFFIDLIKNPIEFWKKIRFRRCLQPITTAHVGDNPQPGHAERAAGESNVLNPKIN